MRQRQAGATRVARSGDAVPVAERLRVTQYMRAVAVGLVLLCAAVAPDVLAPGRRQAVVATLLFAGLVVLGEIVSRLVGDRLVVVFSALLILDGIWLAWASYLTGSIGSPLRYLTLLHVAAVALVASYRTSLKLALWHSLLLYAIDSAVRHRALQPSTVTVAGDTGSLSQRLLVFVVLLWLVAMSTSVLSAVNERELRRGRRDLEALAELAERLERRTDSAGVARVLLDSALDTFGFRRGVVIGGQEGLLPLLASYGLEESTAGRPGRPGSSAAAAHAQLEHGTVLVSRLDPEDDAWLEHLLPGARNLLVVPMSAEGLALGVLVVEQEHPSHGTARVQRRVLSGLERFASYASLSLRNAWLLEQQSRLAATDGLTRIANRRTFETTLEREVARATRSGDPLSLVILDIDHFKALNDEQGHQAGDEVLRNVAAALSCECRDFDTAARYGGEEFAVVLPGCGPAEAEVIADRLRRAVAAAPGAVPITASAGVATFPTNAGDADTLVRAADDALYASKRSGRDRTTASGAVAPQAEADGLLRRAVPERLGRASQAGLPGTGARR